MTPSAATGNQLCGGELIRFRNLDGTCNDIRNPRMGATNELFGRNVEFEATFPELGRNELATQPARRSPGLAETRSAGDQPPAFHARAVTSGLVQRRTRPAGRRDDRTMRLQGGPSLNVLGAFWIQFMTHDWFSHLEAGHNAAELTALGCAMRQQDGQEMPLAGDERDRLGCRPGDRIDRALIADASDPGTFTHDGETI